MPWRDSPLLDELADIREEFSQLHDAYAQSTSSDERDELRDEFDELVSLQHSKIAELEELKTSLSDALSEIDDLDLTELDLPDFS